MRPATPAIRQVQVDQIQMLSGGAVRIGMSSSRVSAASAAVRRHGVLCKMFMRLIAFVVSIRAFVSAVGSMLSGYSIRIGLRFVPRRSLLEMGTFANIMMVVLPWPFVGHGHC